MSKPLLHIWGPFSIQWYGLAIVVGLLIFIYLFLKDPKRKLILSTDDFFSIITISIFDGIIGGRLLFILSNWPTINSFWDIFTIWHGGFSILGTIIALLISIPLYLHYKKIPILPFLDLASVYTPLLQAISRIGCFIAGCCYGQPTTAWWAVWCLLHPTQLYSAFLLFCIFIFMLIARRYFTRPGAMTCLYLILVNAQRFLVDFWRADREFFSTFYFLSIHQIICSILLVLGLFGLILLYGKKKRT